jgi:DNA-binding HxlR family transcriptional regulator
MVLVSERTTSRALAEAVARVGDKWTLLLVSALLDGPRRFNDLVDDVGGIAPNVLSQRLRQLEHHGILVATPYSTRPPRFVYQLTGSGLELAGVLRLLAQWGAGQGPSPAAGEAGAGGGEPLRHPPCGTPMEARWYCPTCTTVVDDDTTGDDAVRFL